MTDISEQKAIANHLRKSGNIGEALPMYRDLWEKSGDRYDGAGLLHCLRRQRLFDEALPLASELVQQHPDFDWARHETIWTYIQGELEQYPDEAPIENIIRISERIMNLRPDSLPAKIVVFKVLKSAKASNNWGIVNEWVGKLDPDSLSSTPMTDQSGREGWCDQGLWYNYRIKGLVEASVFKEAIDLADYCTDRFPRQRKFFIRLKALALHRAGDLTESEEIYRLLCRSPRPDWWLLHEYAKVLKDAGNNEQALRLMYRAMNGTGKLEGKVSLLIDIGLLCNELQQYEEARDHLLLCRFVREEKNWSIPVNLVNTLEHVQSCMGAHAPPMSLRDAIDRCRQHWAKRLGTQLVGVRKSHTRREVRSALTGSIRLGKSDRPFCFIHTVEGESVFCLKSDIPLGLADGDRVTFDAIPSFDKKKSTESWKATNVRR